MKKVPLKAKSMTFAPGLYIVSTPIGNLRDITLRALDVLGAADVILCEDKRVTKKLLNAYGLTEAPLMLYHDHNGDRQRPVIMDRLAKGEVIAHVSDAGTPGISDPGFKLYRDAIENGHPVYPIPGASAVIAALSASGMPTDRFLFEGFLPTKSSARKSRLQAVEKMNATLVFYEAGNRVQKFCKDVHEVLGDRQIILAREITKKFEEFVRGSTSEILARLEKETFKGEFVILIGGISAEEWQRENLDDETLRRMLANMLENGLSVKDASQAVAKQTGLGKRQLYQMAIDIQAAEGGNG